MRYKILNTKCVRASPDFGALKKSFTMSIDRTFSRALIHFELHGNSNLSFITTRVDEVLIKLGFIKIHQNKLKKPFTLYKVIYKKGKVIK